MATKSASGSLFDEAPGTSLEGLVERVVYSDPESAWSVVRLRIADGHPPVTAVGALLGVRPGERLRLQGEWTHDPQFGRQFRVDSCLSLEPTTLRGLQRYLGSGLIPGIGQVMARRLVDRFGLRTLEVIERQPERLTEVPGIGPKRASGIQRAWRRQRGIREILIFLQAHGVGTGQAARIYRHYGAQAVAVLRSNPYRLADEVSGFGFRTADQIAARLGIEPDAPQRAEAALQHVLAEAEGDGHVLLPQSRLLRGVSELLSLSDEVVAPALERLVEEGRLAREEPSAAESEPVVYTPRMRSAEKGVAAAATRLLAQPVLEPGADWQHQLERFERRQRLRLSASQRRAVRQALSERLLVITGGPGTGKTTLMRLVVELHVGAGFAVLLGAPTGRAAKRLTEATGVEARTVHRLLEFEPRRGSFQRNRERPLQADLVIIDEASMLDCPLAYRLLDAVPDDCRLILVGDVDQLPPVGPGRVLADLIASETVPVLRLQEVFRQAAESLIVSNAHRIRRGLLPVLRTDRPVDFYFIERSRPEETLATIRELLTSRIRRRFGLDPRTEIQLLTPMRKGLVGVERLNLELQRLLNPEAPALAVSGERLRRGDRVMQIRNNYELDVFNGDVGHIIDESADGDRLTVEFYGRSLDYPTTDLDDLVLAYACSVHKAQGSEYPCVLLPLHMQHYALLQRNLLYTAVTRAQRLVIVIGERSALARAVRNDRPQERFTRLARRLQTESPRH